MKNNAYGIEMVLESATLIGMLNGTRYYNPVLNPERALQRRNTVMAQMVRHQRLAPEQFESLRTKPLGLDFERQSEPIGRWKSASTSGRSGARPTWTCRAAGL